MEVSYLIPDRDINNLALELGVKHSLQKTFLKHFKTSN